MPAVISGGIVPVHLGIRGPATMPGLRYLDIWVGCPLCHASVEVEIRVEDDSVVSVLLRELCPNELGPSGHRSVTDEEMAEVVRRSMSQASP